MFQHKNNKIFIRSTKKKTFQEQKLIVSTKTKDFYMFGGFDLLTNFYRLIQRLDEWVQIHNLTENQKDKLFF